MLQAYGLIYAAGAVVCAALAAQTARRRGCPPRVAVAFLIHLGFFALLGAQVAGSLTALVLGQGLVLPGTRAGTGASWGAILGGAGYVALATRRLPDHARDALLSSTIIFVPLLQAIGRIGCLVAGCCHGRTTDVAWAIAHPHHPSLAVHPVQAYESILCLMLFAVLLRRSRRRWTWTAALLTWTTGYAAIRLLTETFRGDADRGFVGGRSLGTWIAASWLAIAAIVVVGRRLRPTPAAARSG